MKTIILFISCLVTSVWASAQSSKLEWAKQMGAITGIGNGSCIAVDVSGNVYTTGSYAGTVDFDPGAGIFNLTNAGIFISKLDVSGNFVWAKKIGGDYYDYGNSITLDASGSVYTTGNFMGTNDFDPGVTTFNLTSAGEHDIFISKLDASGNFVWAKNIGGPYEDYALSIEVDASGNIYTSGSFSGTSDFDPGAGTLNLSGGGIFILKLDDSGNLAWAKNMGGTYFDGASSISIDKLGNVYTTGWFSGTIDFDPNAGVFNLTSAGSAGGTEIFISKLDSSGNFVWAISMEGNSFDYGHSIAVDAAGNVYTTGIFGGIVDFDPGTGTVELTSSGRDDIFISKLDAFGNFVWAKNLGGSGLDYGSSIAVDSSKNVYTTGGFSGTADFDPGPATFSLTSAGGDDIFISKLDAAGNFAWAKRMGGDSTNIASSIALDASGNLYATGAFLGTADFDPGAGVFNLSAANNYDIFVLKFSQIPLGLNENGSTNNFTIYPNPTNGLFTIDFSYPPGNAGIEIYNSRGALVYRKTSVSEVYTIDLTTQPNGLYYLRVIGNDNLIATGKIIRY